MSSIGFLFPLVVPEDRTQMSTEHLPVPPFLTDIHHSYKWIFLTWNGCDIVDIFEVY